MDYDSPGVKSGRGLRHMSSTDRGQARQCLGRGRRAIEQRETVRRGAVRGFGAVRSGNWD